MDFIGMHLVLDASLQSNGTVLKYPYRSGQSDPIREIYPIFSSFLKSRDRDSLYVRPEFGPYRQYCCEREVSDDWQVLVGFHGPFFESDGEGSALVDFTVHFNASTISGNLLVDEI